MVYDPEMGTGIDKMPCTMLKSGNFLVELKSGIHIMTDNGNSVKAPQVILDDEELLGVSALAKVSTPADELSVSALSRLLSKIGEVGNGRP